MGPRTIENSRDTRIGKGREADTLRRTRTAWRDEMSSSRHKPQIVPSQIGISAILKNYRLKVLPHQREYRWTTKHVERLFEDIQQAQNADQPQYFLGTIVTIPDEDGTLEIVDGQQRLATVTILLSAIRQYLEPLDKKLSDSLGAFLAEYDRKQKADIPKLTLNLLDNDFFSRMLGATPPYPKLPDTAPLSHRRIHRAFLCAEEYVKKIVAPAGKKDHADTLNRWVDYIEADAEVILFRVPTGANAYKMFETLNDRGLRTTQADLVKNYLFGKADNRYPEAQSAWTLMTGSLSSLQGDDDESEDEKEDQTVIFLRAALMCKQGHLTKAQVFEVVQGIATGPQSVVTLLKDLEELARAYEATFYQDHDKWNGAPDVMKHALQTINDFDIKPFRPALLAIASGFPMAEAAATFEWFASLGVRLLITTGTRSGSVEATFAEVARKVYAKGLSSLADIKKALSDFLPTDEQFRQAFQNATVTSGPYARYYLRALERVAQKQAHPWWVPNEDKESMTLEHVLPLKPEANWPQFTEDEVRMYAKRIGNMCLLTKSLNNDLRNSEQATKYAVYRNAPYVLTSQIIEAETWNVAAICKRQVGLADTALRAWPL